ncbi:hypothetical protein [Paraburkholderia sediminicola]|uniref:hypothetical protein n=1 Tax=Paraburkholderia sediminicola TaxID=458836 RepID=UPI0038B6F63F
MAIFEIIQPGNWIVCDDAVWGIQMDNLIHGLESQFFEANVCFNLFETAQAAFLARMVEYASSMDSWQSDRARRDDVRKQVENDLTQASSTMSEDEISFQVDVRIARDAWRSAPPREHSDRLQFIYARAFIYSLDLFEKLLKDFSATPNVPTFLADLHERMLNDFPCLRQVRNTLQHMDERAQRIGPNKRAIPAVPTDSAGIKAGATTLVLDNLSNSTFQTVMGDGRQGSVDVTAESMQRLQSIMQAIVDSFQWKGTKELRPSVPR